jgi:Flp pilus assembly protein TadD
VGALAAVSIAYASAHEIQRASAVWSDRPAQAYAELRSASNLTPFDAQIYLLEGSIALDYGESVAARRFFEQAARHDDEEWLAPFVLGLLAGERDDRAESEAQLRRALRLNPGEQIVSQALARAGRRHPLTVEQAQRILSTRVQTRFGR